MHIRLGMVVSLTTFCGCLAPLFGAQGSVTTHDGRTLRGDVTVKEDVVTVNRSGIIITLGRDEVKKIETAESSEDEFEQRMAKLEPDDVRGHIQLAQWCQKRGMHREAFELCSKALKLDPDNVNAKLLHRALARRIGKATPDQEGKTEEEDEPETWRKGRMLTQAEINRIRIAEFRPGERLSIRFKNDVIDRYLAREEFKRDPAYCQMFRDFTDEEKLTSMVRTTGMEYADSIEVRSDPRAIRVFKDDVMPLVRKGCATLQCHGGKAPPKIRLYGRSTPAAVYTNFYTLDRFTKSVRSTVDDSVRILRMFDRSYPEEGFFLNYIVPSQYVTMGMLAHPGESEPITDGPDDRDYIAVRSWIQRVLRQPRIDPGIERPPVSAEARKGAATQPAKEAASEAPK